MLRRSVVCRYGPLALGVGNGSPLTVGNLIQPMIPSNELLHSPVKLRERLDRDGYLYFSRIVARDITTKAATDVEQQLLANGWTTEKLMDEEEARHGVVWGIPAPTVSADSPLPTPRAGFRITDTIRDGFSGNSVMAVVRSVFGGPVHRLPRYTLELSYPGERHGFSMPTVFMNRGTKLILNAWVPLLDTPLRGGGLLVAAGSNSAEGFDKVRLTYGAHEVESGDVHGDGCFSHSADDIMAFGCPFHSTAFEAGDLVLTTGYTMQSYLTNATRHWRVSATSRWIMEGDDVGPDPRYTTSGDALAGWAARCNDTRLYPRSMTEAREAWGVAATSA